MSRTVATNFLLMLNFMFKLKADMVAQGMTKGRRLCPFAHVDGFPHYVHAALVGPHRHIQMACDDPTCSMEGAE